MDALLLVAAVTLYAAGVGLAARAFARHDRRMHRAALAVLAGGAAVNLAAWLLPGVREARLPLADLRELLTGLAWLIVSLHVGIALRAGLEAMSLIVPPFATVLLLGASGLSTPVQSRPAGGPLFVAHTVTATAGLAALGLAFTMSVVYLLQDRVLKRKRSFGLLERLPSLDTSDRIGFQALAWGFGLLTAAIVTGVLWNAIAHGRLWSARPKESFPLLAWIVLSALLYARLARGYRGRRCAYLVIVGFVFALASVVGIAR